MHVSTARYMTESLAGLLPTCKWEHTGCASSRAKMDSKSPFRPPARPGMSCARSSAPPLAAPPLLPLNALLGEARLAMALSPVSVLCPSALLQATHTHAAASWGDTSRRTEPIAPGSLKSSHSACVCEEHLVRRSRASAAGPCRGAGGAAVLAEDRWSSFAISRRCPKRLRHHPPFFADPPGPNHSPSAPPASKHMCSLSSLTSTSKWVGHPLPPSKAESAHQQTGEHGTAASLAHLTL